MAYTNNIPTASQFISVSQPLIQANFQELDTYTQVDHVALNATSQGTHNKVSFFQQAADPGVAGTFTELYTKAVSAKPRLFIQNTDGIYQLSGVNPVSAASGYTWLPGGILMQWGQHTTLAATTQTIVFPVAFSSAAYIAIPTLAISLTLSRIFCSVRELSLTTTQFQANTRDQSSGGAPSGLILPWIAIGPA